MSPEEREFLHRTSVRIPTVNRVLVLYVALLAGFWGGHKFLLGARREGWIYLALTLTTVPLWAALGDFIDLLRQPAIGQGFMRRRLAKRHPAEACIVERATWWRLGRVGLVMALFIGAMAWMLARLGDGRERVATVCVQIAPGTPVAQASAFAAANGLKARELREGFNSLADEATWGRHSCHIRVEAGRVTESTPYFMD